MLNYSPPAIAMFSFATALGLTSAWPAHAQSDAGTIDEIQVTATRRSSSASDVTAALTLIDADSLRGQKLTTDALAGQPGVFLQQTTPGQGAAIIRGLKGSEILHLVDGMRMNNAIFRNAPTQYLALVSPASVERVEVLRGSPASLYGSDAVGGVVQVVNRMPRFDGDELSLRREFGVSFDSAEQQRSVDGTLDFGTERVAALLSANYLDTGDRKVGGGERIGPSGYSARAFRAALALAPDADSRWLIDVQYGEQPKTPRVDELVPGFGQTEPASEEFFFAPNERSFVHLQHTRNNGWLDADWRVDIGWQQIVDDRQTRNFGSDIRRLEDNSSDLLGLSLTANGEHRAGSWIAGVELYHDEVLSRRQELNVVSGERDDVQSRFPDGSTVDQAAAFANADLTLSARQSVSAGLRFTSVDVDLAETGLSPAASVGIDDVSADVGWRYELTETMQLVGNAGLGFRAPNVFDLGTLGERPGNRFNIPNTSLESEHIAQLDAGVRYQDDTWTAEFVAWYVDYDDRITSVLTGDITSDGRDIVQTRNRASAELWGFEAVARSFLSDRWVAELVLNYTRGTQSDGEGSAEPADRVPPLNGRLSADYAISDSWGLRPYLLFATRQDRLSARDLRDTRINPDGTAGWLTANVEASWRPGDHWVLRLTAMNLFDERYRVHGSGIDAPGRNLGLDFRYLW